MIKRHLRPAQPRTLHRRRRASIKIRHRPLLIILILVPRMRQILRVLQAGERVLRAGAAQRLRGVGGGRGKGPRRRLVDERGVVFVFGAARAERQRDVL